MRTLFLFLMTGLFLSEMIFGLLSGGEGLAGADRTNQFSVLSISDPPVQPTLFAPGIISKANAWSFTPAFSQDGNYLVYVRWDDPDYNRNPASRQRLFYSQRQGEGWSEPQPIAATADYRVDWPHFSPDGKHFLLSYNAYHPGQYDYPKRENWDDFDIWAAPSDAAGHIDWSNFRPLESKTINRSKSPDNARIGYVHNETCPRMDLAGNLYFWTERLDDGGGRRDVYRADRRLSTQLNWENPILLPSPVNTPVRESGICVEPGGNWIIFASERSGGVGRHDLYFSRRLDQGQWSAPISLGDQVNSPKDEVNPQLTADGTTLYFTSGRSHPKVDAIDAGEGRSRNAIYQIKVADILALRGRIPA